MENLRQMGGFMVSSLFHMTISHWIVWVFLKTTSPLKTHAKTTYCFNPLSPKATHLHDVTTIKCHRLITIICIKTLEMHPFLIFLHVNHAQASLIVTRDFFFHFMPKILQNLPCDHWRPPRSFLHCSTEVVVSFEKPQKLFRRPIPAYNRYLSEISAYNQF